MIDHHCPQSEYSREFLEGMLNRCAVSLHKYGPVKDAFPWKVDAMKCVAERLELYKQTKNTEHLIDAANYLMFEFMHPSLFGAKFEPTDSDQSPGRACYGTMARFKRNEDL